ncbi:uncharacterized protein TRIVIDRAFT_111979 [Trichoderma virens Gv29-8]|uniref:Uncharacterized protein n=1 Tax=Hypocrea virens (strain Gv29-8 / FGSC 10586) TaxID=413071 RepID=G9MVW7_HYPVG|nr:uncharacterized protein TRIVIDRAFT_111979 [Trichoderma virens Gv29-8]EHK21477.1 hypothetical protein TRIVIDRAFT_111979 [Trichoderma virens Gv29-8]UKZ79185.1 hypothetical protein TrVFT333_006935 [Trichoderma virens FT-333]
MKFTTVAFAALASLATANPTPNFGCKPGTYACLPNGEGWEVCNTRAVFVFAGNCPPKTVCKFDKQNGSPYCVPPNFTIP